MRIVFFIVRIFLGLLFIFSGLEKLLQPYQNFLSIIESYEIISGNLALIASHLIPWLEVLGGVFLVIGLWRIRSLFLLWSLTTLFLGVVGSAILRKIPIDECGCFGEAISVPLPVVFGFDLVLWVLFLVLFLNREKTKYLSLDEKL